MTIAIAVHHIPSRMKDRGITDYAQRFRMLVIDKEQKMEIPAFNEIWFLVEDHADAKIESYRGHYDIRHHAINEQQYEHTGEITVTNTGGAPIYVHFIQIIPRHESQKKTK